MVLELKLRKVGNSVGVVLPKEALARLNVAEGDTLALTDAPDGSLRVTPATGNRARGPKPSWALTWSRRPQRGRRSLRERSIAPSESSSRSVKGALVELAGHELPTHRVEIGWQRGKRIRGSELRKPARTD